MASSIFSRPLDIVIIFVFFDFLVIAFTIDFTQSVYGSILALEDVDQGIWPPATVLRAYAWWCETVDPLLAHNPSWYETMAMFSPFIYAPFYIVAIYAFITGKEWIRIPCLMWGWGLLLCMAVTVKEQLYGPYPTKNLTLFAIAYGGYIIMPLMVMLRVAWSPVFKTSKASDKKKTKTH